MKLPSTARTAGRSDWAERRFRRQPFILLSFSSPKKPRKAQETQSYQRFQHIGHTDFKGFSNAVTPPFPTSINGYHTSKGSWHKRLLTAHVRFHGRKWVHTRLCSKNRTQRHTRRNRGAFQMWALLLPSECSARSQTSPGRVSERQTLPLLGLGRVCSRRTQKAFGTAMRLCASLSRGVAAPLGCVIFSVSVEIAACMPCAQGLSVCARRGVVSLPSARFTCC